MMSEEMPVVEVVLEICRGEESARVTVTRSDDAKNDYVKWRSFGNSHDQRYVQEILVSREEITAAPKDYVKRRTIRNLLKPWYELIETGVITGEATK